MASTLSDLKQSFADYCIFDVGLRVSTAKAYVRRLTYLERHFAKPVEQITPEDLAALKRESQLASQTLGGWFHAIKALHRWGLLHELPWADERIGLVRSPRVVNDSSRALTTPRARAVLAACNSPLEFRLAYLGLYAGMRISEMAAFNVENWQEDVLRFRGAKSGKVREVPVHPHLYEVRSRIVGPRTYVETLQKVTRRLVERSGVKFHSHQLRKTFATELFDADVPDRVVKELLGHRHDVTGLYVNVSRRKLEEAIHKLNFRTDETRPHASQH